MQTNEAQETKLTPAEIDLLEKIFDTAMITTESPSEDAAYEELLAKIKRITEES